MSTADDGPLPGGHRFTIAEAAAACGVSRRTIQRALPQLTEQGAERAGAVWSIPYAALTAAGFRPGQINASPPRSAAQGGAQGTAQGGDMPMRARSAPRSAPVGSRMLDPTELTVELMTVRVQLEAAQQRAADLTRQLERAYAEADAWRVMATHQLLQAPPSEAVAESPSQPATDADAITAESSVAQEAADNSPPVGPPAVREQQPAEAPRRRWWQRRS